MASTETPRGRIARASAADGFTLLELLTVVAVIAVLSALLLPVLGRAKSKAKSIQCLNNQRQLTLACLQYATDHDDRLPYNFGEDEIRRRVARNEFLNWTSTVLSWELDSDNTNTFLLTRGGIGPELSAAARVYRCPSDMALSDIQVRAGWTERVRSYSMNAMVGDAGEFTKGGKNVNNPEYHQFFELGQIPQPAQIFIFIEEHPDSINDGYFLNKPESFEWLDLPASYHDGSANLSYADGHIEPYHWRFGSTKPPARPDAARLPFAVNQNERSDFRWLMSRTSTEQEY